MLYGSRARVETPHEESDIDLLVVVDPERPEDRRTMVGLALRRAVSPRSEEFLAEARSRLYPD